jgi:hypothetical protein
VEVRAAGAGRDSPPLARGRVAQVWSGLYKQFAVTGPGSYTVLVDRNFSYNTMVSGIFIDKLAGPPLEADDWPLATFAYVPYGPPRMPKTAATPALKALTESWTKNSPTAVGSEPRLADYRTSILLYRAGVEVSASANLLANWRWQLSLWAAEDRTEFATAMAAARKAFLAHNPGAEGRVP